MNPVLIFSEKGDVHALAVAKNLERLGTPALILNTAEFCDSWSITAEVCAGHASYRVRGESFSYGVEEIAGSWLRRLFPMGNLNADAHRDVVGFCAREQKEVLLAFTCALPNSINDYRAQHLASRKAWQLACATDVGFSVPRTLISTDPSEIRAFYEALEGEVVFKVLSNTPFQMTETRRMKTEYFRHIECARLCPTIFQQLIRPESHLRITIVDQECFAARIHTRRQETELDWRLEMDHAIEAATLEDCLRDKLLALHHKLGLRYSAVDISSTRRAPRISSRRTPVDSFCLRRSMRLSLFRRR